MSYQKTSVLFAPVLILVLFAPSLVGIDRLAFRDVGHFYTPLYDYVAERCQDDWIPLWNPLDHSGIPLIGETTTAVLYPIRYLVFASPLSSESALAWYVVLHLIIASVAARFVAGWAGCRLFASVIASLLYPLSGSILFLYSNPPFLVGAAWLPFALGAMLLPDAGSRRFRIVLAGTAMGLMILGGDPQSALHVMIVAACTGLARLRTRSTRRFDWAVFLGVPTLAAVLSAPQLAASVSWGQQSERVQQANTESWSEPPLVGGQRYQTFQYSLPPWHLAEIATRNAFGSFLPINQRFSRLWPGDGRAWTPSLYMGLATLLALWVRLRYRREAFRGPWFAICLASLFLSFGHFGLVWLVQAGTGWMGDHDSAIGGPYWILYQWLPGYDAFRYPVKWLPFFSLAATLVTAQVIDRITDLNQLPLREKVANSALRIAVVLGCVLVGVLVFLSFWSGALSQIRVPYDSFWGPLDLSSGLWQLIGSVSQSIVVLLALSLLLRLSCSHESSDSRWAMLAILVLVVDLGISGHGIVHQVSRKDERLAMQQLVGAPPLGHDRWMRTQSGSGWPKLWGETRDKERLLDVETSGRAAWFGRWHLSDRVHMLNNMVSIRSRNTAIFWKTVNRMMAELSIEDQRHLWESLRSWLEIEGVVHVTDRVVTTDLKGRRMQLVDHSYRTDNMGSDLQAYPQWRYESNHLTADVLVERFRQPGFLLDSDGRSDLNQQQPIVEGTGPAPSVGEPGDELLPDAAVPFSWNQEMNRQHAESALYRVRANAAALITRPMMQDGHWIARIAPADRSADQAVAGMLDNDQTNWVARDAWRSLNVHRVDGITQGVLLPAGNWWLEFRYEPWWLNWTVATFVLGWCGALVVMIRWRNDPVANVPGIPGRSAAALS